MLSNKFKEAVMARDITRVRLMMKNSLTMDVTFRQFQEMLDYAASIPGLIEPHDGTKFEGKTSWNEDYASDIKVDLIDNFSSERIAHVKEVQRFVYADKLAVEENFAVPGVQSVPSSSTRQSVYRDTNYQRMSSNSQTSRKNDSRTMITLITTIGVAAASILFGVLRNATIVKFAGATVIATCVIGGITYYLVKK
ncbi:hypothetical protein H1D32_07460 [Anaerobacillus sp. CMMVII]|uniref:hypothetical protein n=1 Tax=Anaerobacillus sp. CMMVII TaxID=2755588 RepID=UPI0021B7F55A|nr:hypothetical protein [Anaerobacillus sp. CMMVII]MCT8137598.1 hypothetical protein [Anaerobacillus sp. CMMVII]